MPKDLLIAIIAGLAGMLGWGSADFFAKKTIDKIGPIVSLMWAHLFGTLILISIGLLQFVMLGKTVYIPQGFYEWGGLVFFGTLQTIVYWLVYEGFGKGQLAVLNPVFASFTGLVALFSILVFGEVMTGNYIFALIAIFIGVLVMNLDIKGLKIKRLKVLGIKEVGAATILATIWTLGWDRFVGGKDFVSYALFMYLFMTIAAFVISVFMKVKINGVVKPDLWKFLILIGLGETIAYLGISLGYSSTSHTSIIALISGAFSLPTIILARIFLKEKVSQLQTIGSVAIILGIILLSIG